MSATRGLVVWVALVLLAFTLLALAVTYLTKDDDEIKGDD